MLGLTVGDCHEFTVDSPTLPGVSRSYARFSLAAAEEALSRVYCGIHFSSAMEAGLAQGAAVSGYVVGTLLRPVP